MTLQDSNVNDVTLIEEHNVTSKTSINPFPLRLVTNVTEVTEKNINFEAQLHTHLVSKGCMVQGAEVKENSSGFWRFADAEDTSGKTSGWCMPFYDEEGLLANSLR